MKAADRLDLLETLVCIAEEGAFSRAARRLGVSQPSVSRRIRQLEELVSVRLIQRTTHALSVTDEGRRLLALARRILGYWETGLDEIRDTEPQGLLRVAAPVGLGQTVLMDVAAGFLTDYPKVRLDWLLTDHDVDLISGEADIWIKIGAVLDDRFVTRRLASVERLLVASPKLISQFADWSDIPLVALTPFYAEAIELFDGKGVLREHRQRTVLRTDNIAAARRAVLAGVGAAALPTWLVSSDLKDGALVDAAPGFRAARLDIVLAYAPERGRPMRQTLFIDHLSERLSSLS